MLPLVATLHPAIVPIEVAVLFELSAVADSDDCFKNDSQRQQMVLFSKNFMNYITSAILKLFMGSSWVLISYWVNKRTEFIQHTF